MLGKKGETHRYRMREKKAIKKGVNRHSPLESRNKKKEKKEIPMTGRIDGKKKTYGEKGKERFQAAVKRQSV